MSYHIPGMFTIPGLCILLLDPFAVQLKSLLAALEIQAAAPPLVCFPLVLNGLHAVKMKSVQHAPMARRITDLQQALPLALRARDRSDFWITKLPSRSRTRCSARDKPRASLSSVVGASRTLTAKVPGIACTMAYAKGLRIGSIPSQKAT